MSVLIFLLISYVITSIGLFLVFPKANVEAWKGLVPMLNAIEWCKIIGRPKWWAFLLLIPIVNLFIFVGMTIDLAKSFDLKDFKHSIAAFFYSPGLITYIGAKDDVKYNGPALEKEAEYMNQVKEARANGEDRKLKKLYENNPFPKSGLREWVESIAFAVFAAAFIRMFLIEAYVIPTPSMEGSLNVGDFLFVSKVHYGIRTPMTIAMVPLLHNRLPFFNSESYLKSPKLPYYRTKPLTQIKRNDPIVFNWPVGDSVYLTSSRSYTVGQIQRDPLYVQYDRELIKAVQNKDIIVRPLDKKDHYIKRCVAIPGDTLEVRDYKLYINGELGFVPEHLQYQYVFSNAGANINIKKLEDWGIDRTDQWQDGSGESGFFLDQEQVDKVLSMDPRISLRKKIHPNEPKKLFPFDPKMFPTQSVDNYGPIWIPKKGVTIDITTDNISLYTRIIGVYENNDLEVNGNVVKINGEVATQYTFKQDYYWAMGDNRHNSEDSRAWGFVPHDHIVGKPLFIWFSTKNGSISNGINWDRIFKSANVQ